MEIFFNILTGIMIMNYNYIQVSGESLIGRLYKEHWMLDGSDPDVRYDGFVNFTEGRCPGSKAMNFSKVGSYATVPNVNITDCDFTIAFWIRFRKKENHIAWRPCHHSYY
ncbi:hypothetical protein ACROYT_G011228 [Oculina patagonica]